MRTTPRTPIAVPLLILVALVAVGCDDIWSPDETLVGDFSLLTVEGRPLPVELQPTSAPSRELTRAQLSFAQDRSCRGTYTYRNGTLTSTEHPNCTWEHVGSSVVLEWENGDRETGSLTGNSLTLGSEGGLWVLERRRSRGSSPGGGGSQGSH